MKVASETTVDKCVVRKIGLWLLRVDGILLSLDMDVADSGELFADTDTGKESTIAQSDRAYVFFSSKGSINSDDIWIIERTINVL